MARPATRPEPAPCSIEWFDSDPGPCVVCGRKIGAGPVGFRGDDPVGPYCDGCTLERNKDLGMLLMVANICREIAAEAEDAGECRHDELIVALMVVVRMYNRASSWPVRSVKVLGYFERLKERIPEVPVEAILKMMLGDKH